MLTRVLLRAAASAPRTTRTLPARRTIFIAPGDAARHAAPGFAWLGGISTAAALTLGLSVWVASPTIYRKFGPANL
jgi:hypothetical protein